MTFPMDARGGMPPAERSLTLTLATTTSATRRGAALAGVIVTMPWMVPMPMMEVLTRSSGAGCMRALTARNGFVLAEESVASSL